jgi:DNA-binding LytR/AlgR family response regulator
MNDERLALGTAVDARALRTWLAASAGLIAALIAYCELHSVVTDSSLPGWRISLPWALRVASGWVVVGALFTAFGAKLVRSKAVAHRPRLYFTVAVLATSALVLGCETAARMWSDESDVFRTTIWMQVLYGRAPTAVLASALLVGLCAVRRRANAADRDPPVRDELAVMTGTGQVSIRVNEIVCMRAEGNYIEVLHCAGRRYLLRRTMAAVERDLDARRFVRVHRSTIVNRDMIVEQRRGGVLVLRGGLQVRASRGYRRLLGVCSSSELR